MKFLIASALYLFGSVTAANVVKRAAQFTQGQPIDGNGKGGPILGENFFHTGLRAARFYRETGLARITWIARIVSLSILTIQAETYQIHGSEVC